VNPGSESSRPRRWRSPQERIRHQSRALLRECTPQLKHIALARGVHPSQVTRELQGERRGAYEETAVLVWQGTIQGRIDVRRLIEGLRQVHREALGTIPAGQALQRFRDHELLEALRGSVHHGTLFHLGRLSFPDYLEARRQEAWHALSLVDLGDRLMAEGIDPREVR
jgi:hypothetical protein